jgi:predicted GNAT family acetyltransferase
VDARPVATALSVRTGDVVGIYSVATLPEARGHGYGTALTWMTLADAEPGVRAAVLQASPMGRPVYERMGFRLVREFVELGEATA